MTKSGKQKGWEDCSRERDGVRRPRKSSRKALFSTCSTASLDKTNDFKRNFRCVIKPLQQIIIYSFYAEENEYCSHFDQIHMVWSH